MDRYTVLKHLGKGSYGEVSLVRHKQEGKEYVLKRVALARAKKKEQEAAHQEVQLLASLRHPNIVAYKESFMDKDQYLYIIMNYCESGDLYNRLKNLRGQLLPEKQIMEWFTQVCMAMAYIHEKNILHRDLKTQNIFLTRNNVVKLGDFGIARMLSGETDMASTVIGTPYYMSPELFSNQPYSFKSDIWSLGCVLFELASLKHAFTARDMNALVFKVIRGSVPALPTHYSADLRSLVASLLSKEPSRRPSAARIMQLPFVKEHVSTFLAEHGTIAESPAPRPVPAPGAPVPAAVGQSYLEALQARRAADLAKLKKEQDEKRRLENLAQGRDGDPDRGRGGRVSQAPGRGRGGRPMERGRGAGAAAPGGGVVGGGAGAAAVGAGAGARNAGVAARGPGIGAAAKRVAPAKAAPSFNAGRGSPPKRAPAANPERRPPVPAVAPIERAAERVDPVIPAPVVVPPLDVGQAVPAPVPRGRGGKDPQQGGTPRSPRKVGSPRAPNSNRRPGASPFPAVAKVRRKTGMETERSLPDDKKPAAGVAEPPRVLTRAEREAAQAARKKDEQQKQEAALLNARKDYHEQKMLAAERKRREQMGNNAPPPAKAKAKTAAPGANVRASLDDFQVQRVKHAPDAPSKYNQELSDTIRRVEQLIQDVELTDMEIQKAERAEEDERNLEEVVDCYRFVLSRRDAPIPLDDESVTNDVEGEASYALPTTGRLHEKVAALTAFCEGALGPVKFRELYDRLARALEDPTYDQLEENGDSFDLDRDVRASVSDPGAVEECVAALKQLVFLDAYSRR